MAEQPEITTRQACEWEYQRFLATLDKAISKPTVKEPLRLCVMRAVLTHLQTHYDELVNDIESRYKT